VFKTPGEQLNTVVLFVFIVICVGTPIAVVFVLIKKFEILGEADIRRKFGVLYEGLNLKQGRKIIAVPTLFLLRRLTLCVVVVYQDNIIVQVIAVLLGVLLQFTSFSQNLYLTPEK
jgi:hypothetical protein